MSSADLNLKYQPTKNILFQEIRGESVLLNTETGIYFGLDPMGTETWSLIQKQKNLRGVLEQLLDSYEVDPKTCETDLLRFVSGLVKNGLVEAHAR